MGDLNTAYEHLDAETLEVLRNDTLDQLRKLSAVGQSHSINGRSVSMTARDSLLQTLVDIAHAQKSITRKNSILSTGGTFNGVHTTHAAFNRHY